MAVKPSNAALTALRNTRRAKQEELGRAYEAMGGSNTALVSNSQFAPNTIPSLKRAIENRYAEAQSGGRDTYGDLQAMTPAYNDYKVRETEEALNRLGQTDIARGSNSFDVERAKEGHMQSGLLNSLAVNEKLGRLVTSLTGNAAPYEAFRMTQDNAMKGTLTDEMKALGLTQEDIDRWNRQQNDIERQQVLTNYAAQHPLMATLNSFPEMAAGSAEGVLDKLSNYVQGKPLESSPINAELYRSAVTQNMSKPGNFAYGVGTSIGDMLLASTAGSAAGPAVMGLEKANSVMNDAIERGLTPNQTIAEGVASGVSTGLTEAIPFGRFQRGGHIAGSALAEGLQEGSEDIVDTIFDELITRAGGNNEKSVWNRNIQAYRDAGYSEEDAKTAVVVDYLKQLGLDSLAGAISGGAMQGGTNVLNQRNFVTGRPRTNAEAVSNVTTDAEPVPTLRDSRAEESAIQDQRNTELAQLTEAVSQMREQQNVQQTVPQVQNYDPEEMEYLRNTLLDANNININPIQNIPQVEQSTAEDTTPQPIASLRNEALENALRNREVAEQTRVIDSLKSNLEIFGNKSFNKRLDTLRKDIVDGRPIGDRLDNLVNEINEKMAGEEIGVDQRSINKDLYDDMKRVTDGYVVRVNDNMLHEMNLTLKQLNDMVNTTARDGVNHIRFVKGKSGSPIDTVYNEMYEQSGHVLPNPQSMAEGDLLKAVVDYVTNAKSGKNEIAQAYTWNSRPNMDSRSNAEIEVDNRAGEILDKIARGDITDEEYTDFVNFVVEKGNTDNKQVQDAVFNTWLDVSNAFRNMPKSALPLDEDVQNIDTLEEAVTVLDKELGTLPINLNFFGRNERGSVESEDSERVQTGREKVSKTYTNSAERSGNLTDEQRQMVEENGSMLYQENSEAESVAEAEKRIISEGWDGAFDKLTSKNARDFNNVDVDELFMVWRHYKEQAMALDAKGLDSTSAWQKTVDCLTQVKTVGSSAGSELQAFAKWSRNNTPEGLLSQAGTIIEDVKRGAKKNPWFAQIAKETKGKTKEMDVPFIKEFLTEAEKLNGLDIDSREAKHIMANLGKMVNSQIPVTLREKVVTILMDNMLGNFRTLIARNAGGNVGFNLIEQKVTKNLAAKIDKALSAKRGTTRTISENTSEGRSAYREGFKEAVKQEIYDFQNNIQSARSGENNLRTAVANNRQIFSQKSVFGKIGNLYNKLVKTGLSSGDRPFYEGVYNQYMTEFRKMRDTGLLMDMTDAEFEEIAKANAQIKALEAVYQDDSSMAQAFMGMKNAVNELSKGIVGADVLSQFTMPFVKTPANIIQRAIEYSPIGIVKNAIQTVREVRHAMTDNEIMDFDQQRFATETARNIIGSIMFAAAIMAAKSGALTGGYSEDKDMAQAQREAGMQEYALHNPLGFNGDVDVSWLPVVGNNLVAAAAAYDAASKPELTMGQRIGQGLTAGLRTQFESSALQGLQRLVGGSNYSSSNGGDLLTNAVDTLKSGATQFIPSLARQAASTADPYRRQLTGANPDDYYVNSVLNSIPGLRQSLQPRITRTGEYMEQNAGRSGLWKAFDNFINPATITRGTEDAVRDEAMRLFEATGNNIAFQPGVSINELKTEDHIPTPEEFTQYQQAAYGNMNQIATQVINSSYYQNLTDGEKEALLDSIYKAVKSVEKANILGTDKSNLSGAAKAYNEGGAEGLIDYATAKSVLAEMGMDNTVKNREYILETLNEGGTEAVNQILELSDELVQAGLTGSLTEQYAYNHAAQYIPSLTPTQFATEYTNLNYDGQSGITQKDILAYVNQNPTAYTDEDMYRLWNAYGQSSWSKQPYWNGEKWTSK